jgi:hypothetical protein
MILMILVTVELLADRQYNKRRTPTSPIDGRYISKITIIKFRNIKIDFNSKTYFLNCNFIF